MLGFAIRRVVTMAWVMFAVSVATFVIFFAIPGNKPELRIAGRAGADPQIRARVRHDYGLDKPIYVQYARLMTKAADGTLVSYADQANVRDQIVRGLPATASLVVGAAVIWLGLGVLLGTMAALNAGGALDRITTAFATLVISLPAFWFGALLLFYLTDRLRLFPAGGYVSLGDDPPGWLTHLILPWCALSIGLIGFYSRVLRANVLDVLGEEHVRTAVAKGLPRRQVVGRHVLRSALIPVVTLFGLDFGAALGGGAILTEKVFGLQGVGEYAADSIGTLDLPPVMGTTLYAAFFIVLLSAMVDLVYAFLDPRIRASA